jgi:hypothetical protein
MVEYKRDFCSLLKTNKYKRTTGTPHVSAGLQDSCHGSPAVVQWQYSACVSLKETISTNPDISMNLN